MSDRKIWSRFVASIFALLVISAFAIAGFGPQFYPSLFSAEASIASSLIQPRAVAEPLTIGTCDTAGPIEVESSGGTTVPTAYATLKGAFDAIIAGTHTGSINIEVCGNTTETATAALTASGLTTTSYTDVTIRPVGGARVIEGSIVGAIVRLNGADNVTIDGRQGGTGSARDLTIRNNNTSAATAAVWLSSVAAGNGASNNTIRNLEIATGIDTSSSSNSTFGIIMNGTTISTTANGVDNDNNQFVANRIIKARYGIVTRGTTTDLNINPVVTDNIIGPAAFGTDQISKVGIFMQADTGAVVARNTVQFVGCLDPQACTGADRMGIAIGDESWSMSPTTLTSNTYSVTRNIIHDVVEETTFSAVGLRLGTTGGGAATNNLVANNFIYNVRANGTSGDQAVGLGISGGHSDRVVFNSIAMTGDVDPGAAGASTNFGSGIRIANANGTTHLNLTLMDNSVYMDLSSSSGPTVRFYAISGPSNAYSFGTGGENYNNYYINPANTQLQTGGLGTTSGVALTTQFATLANWQGAYTAPQDANSIQSDPLHVSPTSDLHIAVGSPNVNAGVASSGVFKDIDGELRVAAPDIGADEPSGVTPPANDIAATTILVPTNGGLYGTGATVTPQATFTNIGTAAQSGVQVSFTITGPGGFNYTNSQSIANIASDQTVTVSFAATPAFPNVGTYTMTAAVTTPDGNNTNDSVGGSFTVIAPFTGTLNVGAGETYTSLTNTGGLFEAINAAGATGNLTIGISSNLSTETGSVLLNEVSGGFTVTIKPVGAARTISGTSSATAGLIGFNSADNVTIDGSLSGGSDRSLTVQSSNTAATGGGIYFASGANGAQNNTVKNVNVWGNGSTTGTLLGVAFASSTFGALGIDNDNNRVENCDIRGSFYGIAHLGASAANKDTGTVITRNVMPGTGTAGIARVGIYVINNDGGQITQNTIASVSNPGSVDTIGIAAGSQGISSSPLTTGGVSNATISRNYIGVVSNNSTFSSGGIVVASDTTGTNNITNNMVTGVTGNANAGDIVAGIYINGLAGSTQNVYHNSVSMTGDRLPVTANMLPSFALAIATDQPTNVVDNVLVNSQTRTGSTGGGGESYAIGFDGPAANVNLLSNYNDLLVSGPLGVIGITGDLTTAAQTTTAGTGTNRVTLGDWQTATSEDANSISTDPMFTSSTDLHIPMGSPLVDAGTDVGITVDFDGQTRGAMRDIGADEFVVLVPGTLAFSSATYSVSEAGPTVTLTVNRTGGSDGAVSVDYALGGGTATGGASCGGAVDYVNTGGTLNFANGETSKTFNVAICEDAVVEPDETFDATLSNATGGATIGTPNPATVTITNNDINIPPTVPSTTPTNGATNVPVNTNITLNFSETVNIAAGGITVNCGGPITFTPTLPQNGVNSIVLDPTSDLPAGTLCTVTGVAANITDTLGAQLDGNGDGTGGDNFVLTFTTVAASTAPVTVTATAGTPGPTDYNTLKDAIDAINGGTHQGDITVSVNQNTTEAAAPIVLNSNGAAPAAYTSILIRPTADGLTVAGASLQGRGLIELNGADNVTIDGDNPNSGGTNRNLTIQNTAANTTTFTSVIRVAMNTTTVNSADNNIFRNLNIIGSATGRNVTTTVTTDSQNNTYGILATGGASAPTTAPAAIASLTTLIATGATATNFTVSNNSFATASRAVAVQGSATTVFPGLKIQNNDMGNPVAAAADQIYTHGVLAQGSADGIISGNTVYVEGFVPSSGASATVGISVGTVSAIGTFTIENNKVNRVRNNNTGTWATYGINLGGGSNHVVRNNFVSGVMNNQVAGTGAFNTTFGAIGIRVGSGTGHDIYHNSVHIYGAVPGTVSTNLTTALGIAATGQTGVDVRNNIFSNQATGGNPAGTRNTAVFLPSGATATMNLTWNNNAYYVGTDALNRLAQVGVTFGAGEYQVADFDPTQTTPATNFRAYTSTLSAPGTNDNASFATSAPPPFTSNTDLHIPAMTATRLESGGAAVGVTTDIDAEMRNATTPDIGADEFAGTPPAANDIGAVAFVVPANGSTIPTGSLTPQARFTNAGTAVQTNVTVRFRIFDSMMTEIYNQTATIPSIAPLQNLVVSFPMTTIPNPGAYTMQAASELAGDANTSNDIINGSFTTVVPIGGTVNVGTGEAYTSLTNPGGLFQALNIAGISGNLTVNITSDLAGETGAVALNQLIESGAGGYTVTFKPSGAARTIAGTGAANNGIINLNGADRIVFDGSLSGGTDRSLTITNSQTGTSTIFWIKSAGAGNGANNNTIKNLILTGTGNTTAQTTAGILAGSGVTIGGPAEAPNNNNTVTNNWIYRVQNSLYNQGNAGLDQNWTVTNNEFGSTVELDKNRFRGMLMGNANNFVISGNTVLGVTNFNATTGANTGIQLAFAVTNGQVVNNRISNVHNLSTGGTGAFGMQLSATPTTNIVIANNFIWDIQANGSATVASNGHGITVNGAATAGGYKIYHNSINMNTNQVVATGTSAALNLTVAVVAAGALDVRNNIFANTQTTGTRYAVFSAAPATVFGTIDYNDYFAPSVGFIGGSARVTLADWQAATTQDANSKAVDPLFVSPTDLHLQATSTLLGAGVGGTGITTDIDGQTRDAVPDIGADEIPAGGNAGTLQFSSATYSGGEAAGSFTVTVTRTGGSTGTVTVDYATSNGTATGGASCTPGVDYVSTNGTLTFLNGETSKTFNVGVCNDTADEPDETINYTLSNPTGGAILGTPSTAVQTIVDDDGPATAFSVAISDARRVEGDTGTANMVFNVTLTSNMPLGGTIASVQFATANGTATAGSDYTATNGTLNFNTPGTLTVSVPVVGDTNKEANEFFFVNLTNPSANTTITDAQGAGIIVDEDRPYVVDFDRDRKADYSVFRPSTAVWYALQSADTSLKTGSTGPSGETPVPGDYDGDGKTDFANFQASSATWFILKSSDSTMTITSWGTSGDKAVQGDYDKDGKADLAIFRPSTGAWWILRSSNGTSLTMVFGISTDRPIQGDYDGDAQTDLAVYRDGTWYIARSSDSTVQIANWGLASDRPVSGDFDGDGRHDLAIYRSGTWWVLESLSGAFTARPYGLASDIPAPADFDGDGSTDRVVFRPADGDWYVLRSSDNVSTGVHWGTNGDIPAPTAYIPQ